jgi:BACON domain-containing protein/all-beta uncharacterized protein
MSRASAVVLIALAAAAACHRSPTAPSCTYSVTATQGQFGAEGGAASLTIATGSRCSWTARAAADWVAFAGPSSGTGPATVPFTVAGNPAGADRSTNIIVADNEVPIRQSARACEFTVTPDSDSYGAEGGRGEVIVDATPGCQWTASSNADWLKITAGATGTGPGKVEYLVAAHDRDDRDGTLTVAGRTVNIHQDGRSPCAFAVSPGSSAFDAGGGAGFFDLDTEPPCEWSPRSSASWVRVTAPAGVVRGPARVAFDVARNDSADQRSATISAGTATFGIVQRGATALCEYSVSPVSFRYHWHGTGGENSQFVVSTGASCPWTATSETPWLSIVSGSNGTGTAHVWFALGTYTAETTRQAPIMVRWPTATAGQNVWVAQEGCRYALSAREREFGPEGGRTYVTVFAGPVSVDCAIGCPWTATSHVPWVRITTPVPSQGDNELFFNVDQNTTGSDRIGAMTIAGLTYTVTQRR